MIKGSVHRIYMAGPRNRIQFRNMFALNFFLFLLSLWLLRSILWIHGLVQLRCRGYLWTILDRSVTPLNRPSGHRDREQKFFAVFLNVKSVNNNFNLNDFDLEQQRHQAISTLLHYCAVKYEIQVHLTVQRFHSTFIITLMYFHYEVKRCIIKTIQYRIGLVQISSLPDIWGR